MAESYFVDAQKGPGKTPSTRARIWSLIAALNGGDERAFEALYFRYRDWVVALAYRFTGDENLALDVLQETFLLFAQKISRFCADGAIEDVFLSGGEKSFHWGATEER